MRSVYLAIGFFIGSAFATAQTPPPFNPGSLPTKQVWEGYFASKQDLIATGIPNVQRGDPVPTTPGTLFVNSSGYVVISQ